MNRAFLFLAIYCLIVSTTPIIAQELQAPGAVVKEPFFTKTVELHGGSQGLGIEVGVPLSTRFNLRLGTSILAFKGNQVRNFGNDVDYKASGDVDFKNHHLLFDWQAFPGSESILKKIIISVGGAYFYRGIADGKAMTNGDYRFGDLILSPEEVGSVNARVDWTGAAAYGGIGLAGLRLADRLCLGINLGAFYLGSPDVKVTATNLLASNISQEPVLTRNLKGYQWLPNLQFNLAFRF